MDSSKADRWSLRYRDEIIDTFEKDPYTGRRPIVDIKPMDWLGILRRLEKCGALEKMRKVRQRCNEVYRYTIVTGRAEYNPVSDLASALSTPKKTHFPFLTVEELPHFLKDLTGYTGSVITKTATQIIMLTGVRTQELRFACWEDIDFDKKLWEIPAEAMKMKRPHIVPLPDQVIALFKQLEPISKHHPLVFIGRNDPRKPISKESINQVIELLGYKGRLTGHGLRHNKQDVFERGIINVFKGLSWDYKTNNPCYFGKKIIVNNLVKYDRWGYSLNWGWQRDQLADLERMFYLLDGKTIPDNRHDVSIRFMDFVRDNPHQQIFEDELFTIRYFQKGSGHITFKRPDLVEKMNDIVAKHFPSALSAK